MVWYGVVLYCVGSEACLSVCLTRSSYTFDVFWVRKCRRDSVMSIEEKRVSVLQRVTAPPNPHHTHVKEKREPCIPCTETPLPPTAPKMIAKCALKNRSTANIEEKRRVVCYRGMGCFIYVGEKKNGGGPLKKKHWPKKVKGERKKKDRLLQGKK